MKIEDKEDKPNTGRIHVDFAQARDDQFEFECKQRALYREMRHFQRLEEDRLRPPSPPPVVHYSEHEALSLLEKFKSRFICLQYFCFPIHQETKCNFSTVLVKN